MASASEFAAYQREELPIKLEAKDCRGRTFIVTGSNTGLGYECVKHLVRLEATRVIMAVRNLTSGESSKSAIENAADRHGVIDVWHLDLASFASIKSFVKKAGNELDRIDALVCNAGIATSYWREVEGMESTLTVNLMSNMLLTKLMMPVMAEKGRDIESKPRIVHVGSGGGFNILEPVVNSIDANDILKDLNDKRKWSSKLDTRYILSKHLQHLAVRELAAVSPVSQSGVILNILDPGLCKTSLSRDSNMSMRFKAWMGHWLFGRTAEMGSRALLSGIAAGEESHGKILMNCKVADDKIPSWMTDEKGQLFQKQLWREIAEKLEAIH